MCSVAAILLGCHVYLLRMVWLFARQKQILLLLEHSVGPRTCQFGVERGTALCSFDTVAAARYEAARKAGRFCTIPRTDTGLKADDGAWRHNTQLLHLLLPESQDVRMSGPVGPYGFPTLSDIIQRHGIWFRRFDFFPGGEHMVGKAARRLFVLRKGSPPRTLLGACCYSHRWGRPIPRGYPQVEIGWYDHNLWSVGPWISIISSRNIIIS